jgi:hypothetical protein
MGPGRFSRELRRKAWTGGRLVLGFAAALLAYDLLVGPYTSGLASVLRRTASVWEPPELRLDGIRSSGQRLTIYYTPEESAAERPPRRTAMPEAFAWLDVATVVWDFLILVTLFVGFASGPPARVAIGALAALVLLAALHVVTLGLWIRFGYDPERQIFTGEITSNPWVRQIVPVAIWLLLCPTRLFRGPGGGQPE